MSIAPDQLGEIYRQISERFLSHPLISVKPVQGDPPDQYSITYTITGLTQGEQDQVSETSKHVIELSIPFGFPHFPPSCKPTSNIFHPDFDPGAICIGDFWEQNSSLPDLIVHIGKMINGEFYSSQDTFNDDAASWYHDNIEKFPLAKISWAKGSSETFEEQNELAIDTLDEDDVSFGLDDALSLDKDFSDLKQPDFFPNFDEGEEHAEESGRAAFIKYQQKKEFFGLQKALEAQSEFSSDLQSLLDESVAIIAKAEILYNEAKEQEKHGNATEALKSYQAVAAQVADYPAIRSDIRRLEQTIDLVADLIPSADHTTQTAPDAESIAQKTPPTAVSKPHPKPQPALEETATPKISRFATGPVKLLLFLLPLTLLIVAGGFYGLKFFNGKNIAKAQQSYKECTNAMESKKYPDAKKFCEAGVAAAQSIFFFHSEESDATTASLTAILQSEEFKNGLAGKVLLNGRYVTQDEAALIKDFNNSMEKADDLYSQKLYQQASTAYKETVVLARQVSPSDETVIGKLEDKIKESAFKHLYTVANEALNAKQWLLASTTIPQARDLLLTLPKDSEELYSAELLNGLMLSNFELAQSKGDNAIGKGSWNEAITSYNQALDYALQTATLLPSRIDNVENSIARAQLYLTLEKGNSAFAKGDWNEAIEAYNSANKTLVESKYALIDQAKSDINRKKLNKIILQASIIRDQQSIKTMLNNDELQGARDAYKNLLQLIKSSTLSGENEFSKAKKDIDTKIKSLEDQIYISEKIEYLETEFQNLFFKNYPNTVRENLITPVINLVKETSSSLIFRMQCTEKRRGRPLSLIMFYAYDKQSGQWTLSAENH